MGRVHAMPLDKAIDQVTKSFKLHVRCINFELDAIQAGQPDLESLREAIAGSLSSYRMLAALEAAQKGLEIHLPK